MAREREPEVPSHGRLIAAGMAAAGAVALLIHHFLPAPPTVGRLLLLALGPVALFLGVGGGVEPRVVWAAGKYGKGLPLVYKLIGAALGAAGLGVTLLLLFVYGLGQPR